MTDILYPICECELLQPVKGSPLYRYRLPPRVYAG